jgi:16S rRNA (cytosine967-C5)-methyltransferase
MVGAARRQIASRPALDLTFAGDLEAHTYAAEHGGISLAPWNVRLESAAVAELPGFREGHWWVQDLAASLPARLIPALASTVVDLCAAPGGKTMQLAAHGHEVTAVDSSESRLGRLRDNLERTGLKARLVHADALMWRPDRQFDAILLDAPCSATGTFRRHPEVLYRARPAVIASLAQHQVDLLERWAQALKVEGTLVYSVCSLEPEEGEAIVRAFVAAHPAFRLEAPRSGELPAFVESSEEGWVRILPGLLEAEGGLDGFFMARLVRTA